MTNSTGNRKLRTVAILPEQDAEMERLTDEIGRILKRHYPVSEFMRSLIDEALDTEARARRIEALRRNAA